MALLNQIEDYAIFTMDPNGVILAWNTGARLLLGYEAVEAIGQRASIIFTPDDIAQGEDKKEFAQATSEGRAMDVRWHMRKDGSRFWGNGVMTILRDEAEEIIGFVKILRDETERKRLEEDRNRIFTLSLDLLCVVTLDGNFKRVNPAFTQALGFSENELLSANLFNFIHPEDRAGTTAGYQRLATGQLITNMENRFHCKNGSYKWFAWSYYPIADEGLAYGVGRDVTEHKQEEAERELLLKREQAARTDAEAANRLKDEFLATLSHELRNPLSSIIGHAEILLRSPETLSVNSVRRAAETIHRNAAAQAQLINDLLDLSRLQTGKLSLNRKAFSLAATVNEAVLLIHNEADAKQISLNVKLTPEPLIVEADVLRVQQIIWNLLSNAIKFTLNGGQLQVILEKEGSDAKLLVEDTGEGIASEFLPHVFKMFRQADARTTRRHSGMGIGLALVRQLVELHGGRVEAESAGIGRGARFTVWLPIQTEVAVTDESSLQETSGKLVGLRILVVDDTPDTLDVMRYLLEMEGAQGKTATRGVEALQMAENMDFDLILSDISMPEMDGYELLRELRKLPRAAHMPAIALTGFGRSEDVDQARAAGFCTHLTKPIVFDQLIEAVQSATSKADKS